MLLRATEISSTPSVVSFDALPMLRCAVCCIEEMQLNRQKQLEEVLSDDGLSYQLTLRFELTCGFGQPDLNLGTNSWRADRRHIGHHTQIDRTHGHQNQPGLRACCLTGKVRHALLESKMRNTTMMKSCSLLEPSSSY